jgi:AcrR family transcriptional regulator
MARPSRNVDASLLRAGLELLPETGCAGMSVRQVAERAGVNPGMFHYHFRTKDAFVRALLARVYERMFADLEVAADAPDALTALRQAVNVIARFVRDHRKLLRRLVADAMGGDPLALEFLRTNLPRHLEVVLRLIVAGQRSGALKRVAPPQALAFVAGGVGASILLGSALAEHPLAPRGLAKQFRASVLTDAAIAERVELALAGLAARTPRSGIGGKR